MTVYMTLISIATTTMSKTDNVMTKGCITHYCNVGCKSCSTTIPLQWTKLVERVIPGNFKFDLTCLTMSPLVAISTITCVHIHGIHTCSILTWVAGTLIYIWNHNISLYNIGKHELFFSKCNMILPLWQLISCHMQINSVINLVTSMSWQYIWHWIS